MTRRYTGTAAATLLGLGILTGAPNAAHAQKIDWNDLGKETLKGAAIGYAVKQTAGPLNQFINTVTLRQGLADKQITKVVPILSLGDKGYIGGAQVSGPASLIAKTQAVWQVEGSKQIGDGVYRVKALVPSDSLNPLKIRRVQKVGVNAIIDVATGGPLTKEGPYSLPVRGGDLIKTGAIAVAVKAAAKPLNDFVNAITLNRSALATKVVPTATFGEKAFIGAGQLSGSANTLPSAGALWQYEDLFDRGRFRVKILVPTTGDLKLRRIQGVGLTALIDASIQRQAPTLAKRNGGGGAPSVLPAPLPVPGRGQAGGGGDVGRPHPGGLTEEQISRLPPGIRKKMGYGPHDNGKHKGWYKDRGRDDHEEDEGPGRGRGKGKHKD
jgi:hypothetical protein